MKLAISFTNFGPYHLAPAPLAIDLTARGDRLVAYEVAGNEERYPWRTDRAWHPFQWNTMFADRTVEQLTRSECSRAMTSLLERDRPDAVAIVGYARPESTAALVWANRQRVPVILLSETQKIDHPRVWWKEAIKARRVRKCSSALVGGPRHRDYLVELGMPEERIAFGYNAVDHAFFAGSAAQLSTRSRIASRFADSAVFPRGQPVRTREKLASTRAPLRKIS